MLRILVDINCFAINLVEDHPGFPFVESVIGEGLRGMHQLVVLDPVPIRAFWVMTTQWGLNKSEVSETIEDFVRAHSQVEYGGLNREDLEQAFVLARSLHHDLYDCYYIAGALAKGCNGILTTDVGFRKLCKDLQALNGVAIDYRNPVPNEVLRRFSEYRL